MKKLKIYQRIALLISFFIVVFLFVAKQSNIKAEEKTTEASGAVATSTDLTTSPLMPTFADNTNEGSAKTTTESSEENAGEDTPVAKNTATRGVTTNVATWVDFMKALSDFNTTTINITGDFTVPTGAGYQTGLSNNDFKFYGGNNATGGIGSGSDANRGYVVLQKNKISRQLVIEGNGHEVDFKNITISMAQATLNTGIPWDITWKDLKIYGGGYSGFMAYFLSESAKWNVGGGNAVGPISSLLGGIYGQISGLRMTYENIEYIGNVLYSDGRYTGVDIRIKGKTVSTITGNYTSKFGPWTVYSALPQGTINNGYGLNSNNYNAQVTITEGGSLIINSSGNYNIVALKLFLEKDARITTVVDTTSSNITVSQLILSEGSLLDITTSNNSNVINLVSSSYFSSGIQIGENASMVIARQGVVDSNNSVVQPEISISSGAPFTIAENGNLKIVSAGNLKTPNPVINLSGNNQLTVGKGATMDIQADGTMRNSLIYFDYSSIGTSQFNISEAKYVNLQQTKTNANTANGLIYMVNKSGDNLSINQQNVSMWSMNNFDENNPTATWKPVYNAKINYASGTPTITSANLLATTATADFKARFTTFNTQRVTFESNPDIGITITSNATDEVGSNNSTTISGKTAPNAYVRLSDVPINNSVPAVLTPAGNLIVSPVNEPTMPTELRSNFTVRADSLGNYTYTLPAGKHFSAGATITAFAYLNGKTATATQVVLDKTAPTGVGKTYHVVKGSGAPAPQVFVQNPTDTNPVAQNFTYAYNSANPLATIQGLMTVVGEHDVIVDLSDEAGNKSSINSKLVVHDQEGRITAKDLEIGTDVLPTMTETQLKAYLIQHSQAYAEKIVAGGLIDITNKIQVSSLGTLTPTSLAGNYTVTLTVKKADSGLANDITGTFTVKVVSRSSKLTINFVNEANTVIYTTSVDKTIADVINLANEAVVSEGKTFMNNRSYQLVEAPANETTYTVPYTATTLTYKYKGTLFIESAPTEINFGEATVGIFDTKVDRASFDVPLVLGDSRATHGNWKLMVTLQSPLTNQTDSTKILPEAIKYKKSASTSLMLSNNAQTIATIGDGAVGESTSPMNPGTKLYNISNSWGIGTTGFQLEVPAGRIRKLGDYQATILWQVGDVP